jgi:uncharacterized protein (DUF4415 family)
MLDNEVLNNFRAIAKIEGLGYQILINKALRSYAGFSSLNEEMLRKLIREESRRV